VIVVTLLVGVAVVWLSVSPGQGRRTHQVETRIYATPEYQTDTTRAIDAYERVMERYMDMSERNFIAITADMQAIGVMLDGIDQKLAKLDMRLERIERHLGILPAPVPDANAVRILAPPPVSAEPPSGR